MNNTEGYVTALAIWLIFYVALKRYMAYRRKTQVGQEWWLTCEFN